MLRLVAADVEKHYYDPKLHGVNWEERLRQAKENIEKADSLSSAISEVAALLDSLNDSHTYFVPPPRPYTRDLGLDLTIIGSRCYVVRVSPESDAEKKGVKPGDEISAINEFPVTRQTLWRMRYIFNQLQPLPGLRLTILGGAGQQRQVDVMAKADFSTRVKYPLRFGVNQRVRDLESQRALMRARCYETGSELLVVKFPEFIFAPHEVDSIIDRMQKHRGVVLDLRGNPGGMEDTLDRLLAGVFENDLKVYDRKSRAGTKEIFVKGRHRSAFTGRLVVLIDSESASASELFARVVQIQKRGFIVGDRSAGMVMESIGYPHEVGLDSDVYYGSFITHADLIMSDGKSLEHVGVEPDITLLPTGQDIANKLDPVMAKAAALVGGKLTPEEAGAAFPPVEGSTK